MDVKENLILITKTAALTISRFAMLLIPVALINWLLFAVNAKPIFQNTMMGGGSGAGHSWLGVVIVALPFILVTALIVLGVPFLYAFVSRSYATSKGMNYLFNKKKTLLFEYAVTKVVDAAGDDLLTADKARKFLAKPNALLRQLDDAPRPVRWMLGRLSKKTPFLDIVLRYADTTAITRASVPEIGRLVADQLSEKIESRFFDASLLPWFGVLVLNIAIWIGIFVFVIQ